MNDTTKFEPLRQAVGVATISGGFAWQIHGPSVDGVRPLLANVYGDKNLRYARLFACAPDIFASLQEILGELDKGWLDDITINKAKAVLAAANL